MQFDLILAFPALKKVNWKRILHAKNEKCKNNINTLDSQVGDEFPKVKFN